MVFEHFPGGEQEEEFIASWEKFFQRLEATGWVAAGTFRPKGMNRVRFFREEGSIAESLGDLANRLKIFDEKNRLLPGFKLDVFPQDGKPFISYEGPADERYYQFIEDLIGVGQSLAPKE